ncbi:MAG TPA: (d)CMP kinase [Mycobacteriales bacterium]|nr:(d)CMP kinase [Mycobacteriales bacterium]
MTESGLGPGLEPGRIVIAVDGPSGSGKSTVARGVARALGVRYLDTGAMYRAVTWATLQRGLAPTDATAVGDLAATALLEMGTDPSAPTVAIDGADATEAVRSAPVTAAVSTVSAVPAVRAAMVRRQRELIGDGGIVVEGRDIGTTVAPDATLKVYLTADPAARARRRGLELAGNELDAATLHQTQADLLRRDAADSGRTSSPLAQAADAVVVDSTDLGPDDVIARVLDLLAGRGVRV